MNPHFFTAPTTPKTRGNVMNAPKTGTWQVTGSCPAGSITAGSLATVPHGTRDNCDFFPSQ